MQLQDARVLVTGGAGFIGARVTRDLRARGAEVHVVDNLFSGRAAHVPDEASLHECALTSDELEETVRTVAPDGIIHLAAIHYIPYCNDNPEETFETNVMGTRNLLEAAATLDTLESVVYASSAAVYPPRETANEESSAVGPMDIYGKTKLIGEDLVEKFTTRTDVPATSARLFNVYGPNETNPHLIPAIFEQLEGGQREIDLGNLTPKRDFVHVRDVSSGLLTLLAEFDGSYGVFNIGTGTAWSVREVVEEVEAALGEPIEIVQDEDRVRESDRPHLEADVSRLRSEFGWEPEVSFVDGLETVLEEYDVRGRA